MSISKPTEQSIVNACLDMLKHRGAFAWRVNQGAVKTEGRFIRFNRVEGVSDIVGVMPAALSTVMRPHCCLVTPCSWPAAACGTKPCA